MERFLGFGRDHVTDYHQRTSNAVFLHRMRKKVFKEKNKDKEGSDEKEVPEKVSRMAIGLPGGFNPDEKKYDLKEENSVVVLPGFQKFSLDDQAIPLAVQMSAQGILKAESAVKMEELQSAAGTWDGEKILPSKFADGLVQLDNGKKIPPRGWKCEKCDLTNNLWLNLTDGSILCGRRFFDGSGGNNHAVEHYTENKHPLAVKLGTITPDGKADVFSYAEDNMVEDPHLVKHLAHFGINVSSLTKTDKSMAEIEIDMNQRIGEWATLTESGSKLVPVYGKGYTGMENLGNTCYMNSVMQVLAAVAIIKAPLNPYTICLSIQVLFTLPPFVDFYAGQAEQTFRKANFSDPVHDFKLQMCKLAKGLWSGKYSNPPVEDVPEEFQSKGIKPTVFKTMIGKGHPEFSTKQQQVQLL